MIGEVAAFAIDDLVKELRCMAARDMGSDEWKKCVELHEKFFDDVCERCEYHHDGNQCGYDPGNPYDLCSLAADEIEMLRGRAEQAEAALKAAVDNAPAVDAVEVVRCKDCIYACERKEVQK